jgi:hypothetical protein
MSALFCIQVTKSIAVEKENKIHKKRTIDLEG